MFNLKSGKVIIIYLNIMKILGVLPYTWDYRKPKNGFQNKIIGIRNMKFSYLILFFSIIYHITLITIYILQIDVFTQYFRDMSSEKTSFTMQTAVYIYAFAYIVNYCILIIISIRNSNGLLKILAKYNIFFIYQWKPRKMLICFIISMTLYCVFYLMGIINFIKMDAGFINAVSIVFLTVNSSWVSLLQVMFFAFCLETIGTGWKNIFFNQKITPICDSKNVEKCISKKGGSETEGLLLNHLEKATRNASCLNSLQKEINDNFFGVVSIILLISICQCTSTIFSLISEENNEFIICGSLTNITACIIIIFVSCNSSRTSEVQVN